MLDKHLYRKSVSRVSNIFIYNFWDNQTLSNGSDLKRSSSRCFQVRNLHDFVLAFSYIFFLSEQISVNFFNINRISTKKLCSKNIGHHACLREAAIYLYRGPSREEKLNPLFCLCAHADHA